MSAHKILYVLVAIPGAVYFAISAMVIATAACKVGTQFSFNVNEGWIAYWASVAWSGGDLYPPVSELKLDNYPPLWFYLTGAIGHLVDDNIRAGRAITAAAMLLNGAVISLIAREIVGARGPWWLAGIAFVAIIGVFYQERVAANEPQALASLMMLVAVLLVIRMRDEKISPVALAGVVALMIVGGLIKHSVVAAPVSIALFFLLLGRARPLALLVGLSVAGLALACAALYFTYGNAVFVSLLLPRPYRLDLAWDQTKYEVMRYGLLLAAIPFLACRRDRKALLVLIYALVALASGALMAGGFDVDLNVFVDLLFATAIALAVMADAVKRFVLAEGARAWTRSAVAACWVCVALLPPLRELPSASEQIGLAFHAVTDTSYEADLQYIRTSSAGAAACEDLALCYWAGQRFNADLDTLRTVLSAVPTLEDRAVAQLEGCKFAMIQLLGDWTDPYFGPLTDRLRAALVAHYEQVHETQFGIYWRPRCEQRR